MTQTELIPKDPTMIELTAGNLKAATAGIKSADLWQVPYDQLFVQPGFNVREHTEDYKAHIRSIADSIKANGYDRTKPLAGYVAKIDGVDRIVITDGHTRYLAVGLALQEGCEIETLPVVTSVRGTSMEDLTVGLVTSNSGRRLTPYETGTVCKRLVAFGWEPARIAERLSITEGYVNDLLLLHEAPKAVRDLVRNDKVAAGFAVKELKRNPEKALDVLRNAVEKAAGEGKAKATAKHAQPTWKQAVKKEGPQLYEAVKWVQSDDGYLKLSKGTRQFIEELVAKLPPEEPRK